MAEKATAPPQPVISVRIFEALRARLDSLRELLARKSGENVSTSEVAKQLLESAREDRLEVADLLSEATKSLTQVRRKLEAGQSLSQAEWIVVAYFVRCGVETYSESTRGKLLSQETMKGILEAFLAAYKIRRSKKTSRDAHYLGNLPILNRNGQETSHSEETDVPTTVERLIRALETPRSGVWPQFAGRNLYDLLEEEHFSNIEALNRALKPYWMALWKAAARGHYITYQIPLQFGATAYVLPVTRLSADMRSITGSLWSGDLRVLWQPSEPCVNDLVASGDCSRWKHPKDPTRTLIEATCRCPPVFSENHQRYAGIHV